MDYLNRVRQLPAAPRSHGNAASIKSNLSLEQKQLTLNLMAYGTGRYARKKVFGRDQVMKKLELVEVHVRKFSLGGQRELVSTTQPAEELRKLMLEIENVCEVTVDEDMINMYGTLAGPCSACIAEVGTFGPFLVWGLLTGLDTDGISTSMNITFHSAANL
ncbi:hypothetical protein DAEQUDRAFT_730295 [Daedalea quercina L-15889]|uniref:Uncharacterized protein n=1 Tax=Daedalea quercina L-15889 TaxID=1314783 RepID=A0A165N354_9APHY|nr:hypothetical protein DAEQUDRAFT_730295 [Daedalea quercina L-15889]